MIKVQTVIGLRLPILASRRSDALLRLRLMLMSHLILKRLVAQQRVPAAPCTLTGRARNHYTAA
jgi:hypothetical protein